MYTLLLAGLLTLLGGPVMAKNHNKKPHSKFWKKPKKLMKKGKYSKSNTLKATKKKVAMDFGAAVK